MKPAVEVANWMRSGASIEFNDEDAAVMDVGLGLDPALRVATSVLRELKRQRLSYPLDTPAEVGALLSAEASGVAGFDSDEFVALLPSEAFPLMQDGDVVSVAYLATLRRQSAVLALQPAAMSTGEEAVSPADIHPNSAPLYGPVSCPANQWTTVCVGTSGFCQLSIQSLSGPVNINWRRFLLHLPWALQGSAHIDQTTQNWFIPPPSVWNMIQVQPNRSVVIRCGTL